MQLGALVSSYKRSATLSHARVGLGVAMWQAAGATLFGFSLAWSGVAHAADTVETFDLGLGEFELYLGIDGLGHPLEEQTRTADALLGYGVVPRLSLYVAPSWSVDGYLGESALGLEIGGFGTPIDTDHVDLDLGLAAATDGAFGAYSDFLELNLDLEPDLSLAGLYVRGGLTVSGGQDDQGRALISLEPGSTVGVYVSPTEEHQILAEIDCGWVEGPRGRPEWRHGALHLGYNIGLLDHLELIQEISFDIPDRGEDWGMGFFVGVIATRPPSDR